MSITVSLLSIWIVFDLSLKILLFLSLQIVQRPAAQAIYHVRNPAESLNIFWHFHTQMCEFIAIAGIVPPNLFMSAVQKADVNEHDQNRYTSVSLVSVPHRTHPSDV